MTEEIQNKFNAAHEKLTSILSDFITGGYANSLFIWELKKQKKR